MLYFLDIVQSQQLNQIVKLTTGILNGLGGSSLQRGGGNFFKVQDNTIPTCAR